MARHQRKRHICQELHDTRINQFPITEITSATAQRLRNDTWYLNCAETPSARSGKSSMVALNTTGPQMQQSVDPSLDAADSSSTRHRHVDQTSNKNCVWDTITTIHHDAVEAQLANVAESTTQPGISTVVTKNNELTAIRGCRRLPIGSSWHIRDSSWKTQRSVNLEVECRKHEPSPLRAQSSDLP